MTLVRAIGRLGERQITLCRNAVHELLGVIDIELPNSMPLM
jgi:hypothetical protein